MRMNFILFAIVLLGVGTPFSLSARKGDQAMRVDDLVSWKRITAQLVADDGKWVACKMEPWRGDAVIYVYNAKGKEIATFQSADKAEFTASSDYLLVTEKPPLDTLEYHKLKKTKAEKMPMNRLVVYQPAHNRQETIDSLKTYKRSENDDWIAYQRGNKSDSALYVCSPEDVQHPFSFPAVTDFQFAKDKNILYFVSKGDRDQFKAGLYICLPQEKRSQLIYEGEGVFKQIAFDEKGNKLAFLYSPGKDSASVSYSLYVSENNAPAREIAGRHHPSIPEEWIIGEEGAVFFSENAERLFFGIAPPPRQKDTTVLAENRPDVEIWNWNEKVQYTQQKVDKKKDLKRTCTAVYNFKDDRIVQLSDPERPLLRTADKGNASVGLVLSSAPYDLERMWRGRERFDVYTVNLESGEKQLIKEAFMANPQLSPKGKYAYWYSPADSSWYTCSIAEGKERRLTTPDTFAAWDEYNDVPDYPRQHGMAGWSAGDDYILLYDRYDIWLFDPAMAGPPVNLTKNGREKSIRYRYVQLDREDRQIDLDKPLMLIGFNEQNKGYGYYKLSTAGATEPKTLLAGDFMLKQPLKAKNAETIVYTVERFDLYPDVHVTDSDFGKSIRLTDGAGQQSGFIWGKAEPTTWTSLDGVKLEGIIYKPDNFDPAKKYPLIVNFYERNAESLHSYHMPEPHRSTIDYHLYNSQGYIIFNPDVVYKDGYPGESCYNSVMPGITSLIEKGYVDEAAIGAQGHSWGGYQVAYLATRTHLFAAIESGAPVVNMLSAYGGIRWATGLNRSFQYEHTQSRIGGTIWDKPLRFVENSPLFTMDKVQTPILIMHNDQDGHVPWYQGIEYFIALKRLQKPVWMLNYPGEVHWPARMANRIDFQKRMFQFFEHYLRKQPAPKWMKEGVPAVEKDFELGY
ncbi:MAG: prolyl oligopeptidase family serine peptidase [Tannerella sp.]|nr:prolyl oligopeptidase family serine peptidase [Tannerella sp.]